MTRFWVLSLFLAFNLYLQAEEQPKPEPPKERQTVTKHTATISGQRLSYTVTTGVLHLKNEEEREPRGAMFFMAYTLDGVDRSDRPLTFSFNGGPGSSSVWLHLGVLGPKRVLMDDDGNPYPPPYKLVNNNYSILDKTDLVFIDPIGTGFSRAVPGVDASSFHGLEEDIESVGEFVRRYIAREDRWASPKFIIGESYGTTRAAGLVHHLQGRHGMFFNGVMLVSSILDFGTARFDQGNDLPYKLFLPTYTATAYYHGKLDIDADFETILARSRAFAIGDYALALLAGDTLQGEQRANAIKDLATYTGLSPEFIERENLRISIWDFVEELMRDDYRIVGRLDSRFKGVNRGDMGNEYFARDPSYAAIQGPYTGTLNHYVRTDLGFETDFTYEILGGRIGRWNYSGFQNRYVNVAPRLVTAMVQNPNLKVLVTNGYYDLATPFFATEYTFNHLNLDPSLRDNITMTYYESGHMMYIHIPSLVKMKEDLDTFIDSAIPK